LLILKSHASGREKRQQKDYSCKHGAVFEGTHSLQLLQAIRDCGSEDFA
jgi:hypothetical protein